MTNSRNGSSPSSGGEKSGAKASRPRQGCGLFEGGGEDPSCPSRYGGPWGPRLGARASRVCSALQWPLLSSSRHRFRAPHLSSVRRHLHLLHLQKPCSQVRPGSEGPGGREFERTQLAPVSVRFTITGCAQAGHPHWRAPFSRKPPLPPGPVAPQRHPARPPSTESSHRHPDNPDLKQSLTPAGTSRRKKRNRKRKRNGERDCLVERRHGGRRAQSRACSGRGVWAGGPGDGRASGARTCRTNDAQGGASTQTGHLSSRALCSSSHPTMCTGSSPRSSWEISLSPPTF